MCVQRIQAGKLEAKIDGTTVQNGAIESACSSSCPVNGIKFGDLNNKEHAVSVEKNDDRAYLLMEEIGTQPNIYYQTKVRNV